MKNKFNIIIIVFLIIFVGIYYFKNNKLNSNILEENIIEISNTENIVSEEKEEIIKVHILGEVNNPGMIELKMGDRVYDAIEKAGGLTELADMSKINLAYILSDGEKIIIPNINDIEFQEEYEVENKKININVASKEELQTLNGIGESIAEEIINYRNKNGKFLNIEDIKNVAGIGENKYEKIKDNITIK